MKVVILAGGFGSRISEESHLKPKPMIEIGGKPILWHIMKIYSHYGFNDFVICLGYKQYAIKEYFENYYLHECDVTYDFRDGNEKTVHKSDAEPWRVTLIDTGLHTMTGGRLKRVAEYVKDETFMLTYGDGVANVKIDELVKFHKSHGKYVTVTAIQPAGRFGALDLDKNGEVSGFLEKPQGDGSYVNGGFFVMDPKAIDYIDDDQTILERSPLEGLAKDNQFAAFRHEGFWQPMDTLRDKNQLEELWNSEQAPWKTW